MVAPVNTFLAPRMKDSEQVNGRKPPLDNVKTFYHLPRGMARAVRESAEKNHRSISAQARIYIERGLAAEPKP